MGWREEEQAKIIIQKAGESNAATTKTRFQENIHEILIKKKQNKKMESFLILLSEGVFR